MEIDITVLREGKLCWECAGGRKPCVFDHYKTQVKAWRVCGRFSFVDQIVSVAG